MSCTLSAASRLRVDCELGWVRMPMRMSSSIIEFIVNKTNLLVN